MPIYEQKDENTGKSVSVVRSIRASDEEGLPTLEEALEAGFTEEEFKNAKFSKVIGTFMLTRGKNWSGSKGNW